MSLETDGVWKGGLWSPTLWTDGVWRVGAPVQVDIIAGINATITGVYGSNVLTASHGSNVMTQAATSNILYKG